MQCTHPAVSSLGSAGGLAPRRHRCHGEKMAPIFPKMVVSVKELSILALTLLKRWKVFFFIPVAVIPAEEPSELTNTVCCIKIETNFV